MDRGEFGYLCIYFPVEVVMAAGYRPVRLLPAAPAPSGGMLPPFLCAPVRAYLASALAGEYRHVAGVGITHACDAMQCLAQAWRVLVNEPPLFLLMFPTRRDNAALGRLAAELRDLGARLPVPVRESALIEAMAEARARRRRVQEVLRRRGDLQPEAVWRVLSQPWTTAGVDAGGGAGGGALAAAETGSGRVARIVLSGSILSSPRLLEMVSKAGGTVVGDDLCSGERGLGAPLPAPPDGGTAPHDGESAVQGHTLGDPWGVLARQYLDMPPCPCRHPSPAERVRHLLELVAARRARGVILLREKFCDPHRWEDHAIMGQLRQRGIAVLELETEAGAVAGERALTRLQAFLETLEAGPGTRGEW
ncbi:MAG: 2-hydroxyacyl-CoA dehydratase family protein [Bacillota bacterium]